MTNEEWYDKEAGPRLKALADEAGARGMSFVGVVEYAPNQRARTTLMGPHSGLAMRMLACCAAAGENIDGYIINLIRYCREKGVDMSQSMVLRLLGEEESNPKRGATKSDGESKP